MLVFLDTSAAAKLLVEEDESAAVSSHLDARAATGDVVAAALLETEPGGWRTEPASTRAR